MQLFPAIDLRGGQVVRLTQGDYDRMTVYGQNPCAQARSFVAAGAKNLHVVDLDGAKDGTLSNYDTIAALAKQGGLYIEVGGGIRTEERIEKYLSLGVGRCILGSVAVTDFAFTARMLQKYGDKIAVGVDAKDGYVAIHGWKEVSAEPGVAFCKRLAEAGCTAIIYTDIACDGAMQGTNLSLYRQLAAEVPGVAFTASGGISSETELLELQQMGTAAAILGKSLYSGALDLARCVQLVQDWERGSFMITKRIIPCLDVRDGRVVKGTNFEGIKDVADPVEMARLYNAAGADELVFYDITASFEGRALFTDILTRVAGEIFIPLTVGGGINTLEDFDRVLKCGADKVSVNSGALKDPGLIPAAAQRYGDQCVVLSADVKRVNGQFRVFAKGGREDTGRDALDWISWCAAHGAGEICLNSIDTDGVRNGFDLEMLDAVAARVNIPIIASGGAGKKEDFLELFHHKGIDAGLAAGIFHQKLLGIRELKEYLNASGVEMRL